MSLYNKSSDWIYTRGTSGEYGYLNLKTGEFRTTLPNEDTILKTTDKSVYPSVNTTGKKIEAQRLVALKDVDLKDEAYVKEYEKRTGVTVGKKQAHKLRKIEEAGQKHLTTVSQSRPVSKNRLAQANRTGLYREQERKMKEAEALTMALVGEGLDRIRPTKVVRLAYDTTTGNGLKSFVEGNNGIVSDDYLKLHPNEAEAINFAGDIIIPIAATKAITVGQKAVQAGNKAYQGYRVASAIDDAVEGAALSEEPLLNVGWAPKQTINVVHASDVPKTPQLFYPPRWDVVEESANPFGIWYQGRLGSPRTVSTDGLVKGTKASKARTLFAERPYQQEGNLTLEKPIQTVGDVKNRAALSYDAESMGADGIIYNDVYDNGYNHNQVILSLRLADPGVLLTDVPTAPKTTKLIKGLQVSPNVTIGKNIEQESIPMTAEELGLAIAEMWGKDGYYMYAHGTGRTNPDPQVFLQTGLRVPRAEADNTTMALAEDASSIAETLQHYPHMESKQIVLMPALADKVQYGVTGQRYNMDWFTPETFKYINEEPKSFFDVGAHGYVPTVDNPYTTAQAPLGVFDNEAGTFLLNPNNLYFTVVRDSSGKVKIMPKTSERPTYQLTPFDIYLKRAMSKGATQEDFDAIGHFDLSTEEGKTQAAKHIANLDNDTNLTYELKVEGYKKQLDKLGNDDDGFGTGMGWKDVKMTHVLESAYPDPVDRSYVKLHETDHALRYPAEPIPEGVLDEAALDRALSKNYFVHGNNAEVAPRISQVLTNEGITDDREITGPQLKQYFENYLRSGHIQNDVRVLYNHVNDWDGLAKWANNHKNVYTTIGAMATGFGLSKLFYNGGKLIPKFY